MRRLGLLVLSALAGLAVAIATIAIFRPEQYGSAQSLRIGTAVVLEPSDLPANGFRVQEERTYEGLVRIVSEPIGDKVGKRAVKMRLSVTVDFVQSIMLGDDDHRVVVLSSKRNDEEEVDFVLPALPSGEHCAIVTLIEDENISEGMDHVAASQTRLIVGEGDRDYCVTHQATTAVPASETVVVTCSIPIMSTVPQVARMQYKRRVGDLAWAHVGTDCPPGTTFVNLLFIHDGSPIVESGGSFSPRSVPADGLPRTVPLGELPRGTLRLVVVTTGTEYRQVEVSNPVVVK